MLFFQKKIHHLCEFYLKVRKYRLIIGTSSLTECKNSTVRWYFTNHHWSGAPPLNSPPPFTAAQNFWAYAAIYQPGEGGGGVLERNRCLTGLRRGGQELKWGEGHSFTPPLFSWKRKGERGGEGRIFLFLKKSPRKNVEVVFLAQIPRGKTSCRRSRERQGRTSGGAIFVVHGMVFFCTKSSEWEKRCSFSFSFPPLLLQSHSANQPRRKGVFCAFAKPCGQKNPLKAPMLKQEATATEDHDFASAIFHTKLFLQPGSSAVLPVTQRRRSSRGELLLMLLLVLLLLLLQLLLLMEQTLLEGP